MPGFGFSILGPLEVTAPDGELRVTGRNERIVLSVLVTWVGEVVSIERLTEALWGDEPPRSSPKVVQNIVLRLRRRLGQAIETRPGGYLLAVAPDAVDARRFDRLVVEGQTAAHNGDWEACAHALAAAVGLWRGRPLVELDHWEPGRWEATRLEEQHRCVVEELAEAELACDRHREQLPILYTMVSEEPLREHRWALLMLALYRCGQQAEALRVYQRAGSTLSELGLSPGPELRGLERAISIGDPALGAETHRRLYVSDVIERRPVVEDAPGPRMRRRGRSGRSAGHLPTQLTSFVGREDDVAGVGAVLQRCRLVTITGSGGVGKSRLAIRVAADVSDDHPDGAWFCPLAAAASAGEIAQVVAASIGVRLGRNLTVERSLVEWIGDATLLLILDNCEHLLEGAGRFAELILQSCPNLHFLTTSRERLGVGGEQIWPLASLTVPAPAGVGPQVRSEAVALFVDRARAVVPSFTITPVHAVAVDEICRRLDGIPLAIELAAARVSAMTPTEIASKLDHRFRLLRGGPVTGDGRHRTLQATLDWSYSLLDDVERDVFDRLGVFSGRFDADAVMAVAAPGPVEAWDAIDVLDALGQLAGQSMVTVVDSGGAVSRYELLETFRLYALERLQSAGELASVRRRHAAHYAEVAERTGRGLRGPDELAWRSRFRADRDNLRAAVSWALASESGSDQICGLRIIAALAHESMQEGEPIGVWAEAALAHTDLAPAGVRTSVFASAAWFVHRRGDIATARLLCLQALRDGLPNDCPSPELAYFVLALTSMSEPVRQAQIFDEAHGALDATAADDYARAFLWSAALYMQLIVGDTPDPSIGRHALHIARRIGNPSLLVRLLCNLAALSWLDDPDGARHELEEAVALAEVGASGHMLGFGWSILARLRVQRGDLDGAREAMKAALTRSHEDSDPFILSTALDRGVHVLEALGHLEGAAVCVGAVVDGPLRRAAHLPARERPLRRDVVDRLRRALGADGFDAATSRGAAMSEDDLLRYAFELLVR